MSSTAKFYIVAIIALGGVLTAAFLFSNWGFREPAQFAALWLLACLAAVLKVKLPTIHGNISVSFVFFLIGIAGLSLAETLVLGFVATPLQCIWRPKKQPLVIQVLFNIAAVEISIITAFQIPLLFGLPLNSTAGLVVSASSFFIANSALIALVIALVEQRSIQQIWRDCYLWTFPYYMIGAGIAGAITASASQGWKALLVLPLMYLAFHYYRLCVANRSELLKQTA
jgi:hypothetical protein